MTDQACVLVFGECFSCSRMFSFNPHRVPSYRHNGIRQPVCEACMISLNEKRKAKGFEPFPILSGAYEPLAESEL